MNTITLIGRAGKDPEVKQFDNGAKTSLSVATSRRYTDKQGNKQEQTEWHNVVAWGKTGEVIAKYVHKGDQVALEGMVTYRQYDKDGTTHYITEIIADRVELLSARAKQEEPVPTNRIETDPVEMKQDLKDQTDDLPF